jgi:hypothetical protein
MLLFLIAYFCWIVTFLNKVDIQISSFFTKVMITDAPFCYEIVWQNIILVVSRPYVVETISWDKIISFPDLTVTPKI